MKQLSLMELLKLDPTIQQQLLIIELSVRLGAVKALLVKKGLVTDEEIEKEMEDVTVTVMDMFKNDPAFAAIKAIAEGMVEVAAENLIPEKNKDAEIATVVSPKRKYDPSSN
jgi:hypothetical protein